MLSFYNLSAMNLFRNVVDRQEHSMIMYKNRSGVPFGLRQCNLDRFGCSDTAYLVTNNPMVYLQNRSTNPKQRFVPYWCNSFKINFTNYDTDALSIDIHAMLSSELKNFSTYNCDDLYSVLNAFPEFTQIKLDLTGLGDSVYANVYNTFNTYVDLTKVSMENRDIINSTLYKNLFLMNFGAVEWMYFMFLDYKYDDVNLYYKQDALFDEKIKFICNANNILFTEAIKDAYVKLHLTFNDNVCQKMIRLFQFTIHSLENLTTDHFEECESLSDMLLKLTQLGD